MTDLTAFNYFSRGTESILTVLNSQTDRIITKEEMETSRAASTSDSPYSTSSSSSAAEECGGDFMVGSELEAAEALAVLAHSAMPESGNEGRWPSQRAKTESPAGDSVIRFSAPSEDQAGVLNQQCELTCGGMEKGMKVEQDSELPKQSPVCPSSYASFSGSKSRQKLTESEKEARRIRRVLANRESARQTIHRRQALYEELTRKAASLACENENLKKEKELALEEYDSLKRTNECLKAKMAKTVKTQVEESRAESSSTKADRPTFQCPNYPYFIYNQPPFTQFPWPALIQSPNPLQLQNCSQNAI